MAPTSSDGDAEITTNPISWGAVAVKWVFGQPSIVVALFAILASLVFIAHQAGTVWIPSHLSQIQAGYEKAIDRFDIAREREIAADKEVRQEFRDILLKVDDKRQAGLGAATEGLGP